MLVEEMTRPSEIFTARVHDLVRVDPDSIDVTAPAWARAALRTCPWAVVRRVSSGPAEIALGVRGSSREQRWGGFIRKASVRTIMRPAEVLGRHVSGILARPGRTPAMQVLQQVVERWRGVRLPWGPTGSAALELVSGQCITTESSDLDIAIDAAFGLSVDEARAMWQSVCDLRPHVDVRVETLECGFSLQEFARFSPSPILLRYSNGMRLGNDLRMSYQTGGRIYE
jgi:phosphoribosyl-dephospho-CoA transferase